MSRFHSYINTAVSLVANYSGDQPFANHLKKFFSTNKKYGAKDRRQISSLCFNYFRLGNAAADIPPAERMLVASLLCNQQPTELLDALQPGWNNNSTLPKEQKMRLTNPPVNGRDIFSFTAELSDGIDVLEYGASFLVQPDLFIRIRPQNRMSALKKLERSKLPYTMLPDDCVQLTVTDKLEDHFLLDKEVVVQDYNSQRVLNYLKNTEWASVPAAGKPKQPIAVWDCCAASGGKSILLTDKLSRKIDLTVSDIRATIILNLHSRFKKAGIKEYKYFIADITAPVFTPGILQFDLVICDAPCSGSGTWSRSPEQLTYFREAAIADYTTLQQKIVSSVLPHLLPGGLFIYITCSVFKQENEGIAEWISAQFNCTLLHQQVLNGVEKKADSMFVAVFRK